MVQNVDSTVKIKVIGIGGGGNNAVSRIIEDNVPNIETYLMNTEISKLKQINPRNVLQIGKQTTKGLGAGANERIGEASAIESTDQIKEILQGTDMLFLTAGMGGGTGTGAIPVVANIAQSMGILTVAIVTKPFAFEGKQRLGRAEVGIEKLKQNVNALVVVLNDRLLKLTKEKLLINKAFELADNILEQGIHSITDLITTVGNINIDYADIQTIFSYKGKAYMGIGIANEGESLEDAVKQAVENPLTENKIDNAKGVIFNVTGGESLGLSEINTAMQVINDRAHEDANIMFGTIIDENLGNKKIVTVIATGI